MPVLNRPILDYVTDFHADMTAWRRDLHAHPEIGLTEFRTAGVVADLLRGFGVDEVHTGVAGTGVVGVIRGRADGDAIGMRADMDALPIVERTGASYASTTPGVMHACGHDGHTTMLLGAARYLAETRNFAGTAIVVFQPAEENAGGGRLMIEDGLFDRFPMREIYGLHNWPSMPAGTFRWRVGPVMAAVGTLEIDIAGHGAHGAEPHRSVDPVVVAAAIVQALQSVVARSVDPLKGGVVTVGSIRGGDTHNVIPETVHMLGTARWFHDEVGDVIERGVTRLATGIADSFGATATVRFARSYPATVNDPDATAVARRAAEAVVGPDRVSEMDQPTMGGEDFSFMLNRKKGAYLMLGTGRGPNDPGLHNPAYDFNDDLLPTGATFWATLIEQQLPHP